MNLPWLKTTTTGSLAFTFKCSSRTVRLSSAICLGIFSYLNGAYPMSLLLLSVPYVMIIEYFLN